MFYEEVDLCRRLQEAGWGIGMCPAARFVHVGGTSTRKKWPAMYREQLRGHLRYLEKHEGIRTAEGARRYLKWALRARVLASIGETRRVYLNALRWLDSGSARLLVELREPTSPGRTAEPGDRTSGSAC
jgi:GT2 family glycosyltransferase